MIHEIGASPMLDDTTKKRAADGFELYLLSLVAAAAATLLAVAFVMSWALSVRMLV